MYIISKIRKIKKTTKTTKPKKTKTGLWFFCPYAKIDSVGPRVCTCYSPLMNSLDNDCLMELKMQLEMQLKSLEYMSHDYETEQKKASLERRIKNIQDELVRREGSFSRNIQNYYANLHDDHGNPKQSAFDD